MDTLTNKESRKLINTTLWTREALAWSAAFIDGEGTICLDKNLKEGKITGITVMAYQKDPELLYRLEELFGGRIAGPNSSNVYYWRVRARDQVYAILCALYPWFSSKRKRETELCLNVYKAPMPVSINYLKERYAN